MSESTATTDTTTTSVACCGNAPVAVALPDPAHTVASPCCGTTADAQAAGSCCGATAKAEAVASGAGCCG